jgi:DNA processing protein
MESFLPWFALKSVPGIGNILFKRLIDRFQTPQAVFDASERELLQIKGVTLRLISALRRQQVPDWVKRDLEIAMRKGYQIITQSDPSYPPLLHQIPDPPPILFVFGHLSENKLHIAVVGSRQATRYGLQAANQLSYAMGLNDIVVVSGMARGIDTAAHKGVLKANGKTIAILGSGLERIYPPENRSLFHQIAERGAIISEFSLLADPEPHNFPKRNRLISGITHGTVVVEAGKKSGSLITARLAAEQNREVFAVPGNINSYKSIGTHALIKQGAKLVEKIDDIIDEFSYHAVIQTNEVKRPSLDLNDKNKLSQEEVTLLSHIDTYPIHMDELIRILNIDPGRLASLLLQLEVKGYVAQSSGNYFSRLET